MNDAQNNPYFEKILEVASPLGGVRLGLERIRSALTRLGSPHLKFPCILIGGTNGKGSTAVFVSSILTSSGLKCGLYTSPHIHRYEERFKINGINASSGELDRALDKILKKVEISGGKLPLTYFEISTALAFLVFESAEVDIAVLEVGVGGRLDATNVVPSPLVSVITTVSMDHAHLLGDTESKICREKLGITRGGTPLVTGVKSSLLKVVENEAEASGFDVYAHGRDFSFLSSKDGSMDYKGNRVLKKVRPSLTGVHQHFNLSIALKVCEILSDFHGFEIDWGKVPEAVASVRWPCRLEIFKGNPKVIIDGCHNVEGAEALAGFLKESDSGNKRVLLFSASKNKDVKGILKPLLPYFDSIVISSYSWAKCMETDDILKAVEYVSNKVVADENPKSALSKAQSLAGSDGEVVVAGSLYFASEIRELVVNDFFS